MEGLKKEVAELEKELRRLSLKLAEVEETLLETYSYLSVDELLVAIGGGEITAHGIALQLASLIIQHLRHLTRFM